VSHAAVDPIVGTPDTEQAAAPSGAPAVTPDDGDTMTPKDRRANHDITRERGCRRMILENWSTIESLCGPAANGRSVLRVLKRELLTDQPLPELKTVQNRLNDLRKEKFIP
jgi:hypothetical protein